MNLTKAPVLSTLLRAMSTMNGSTKPVESRNAGVAEHESCHASVVPVTGPRTMAVCSAVAVGWVIHCFTIDRSIRCIARAAPSAA